MYSQIAQIIFITLIREFMLFDKSKKFVIQPTDHPKNETLKNRLCILCHLDSKSIEEIRKTYKIVNSHSIEKDYVGKVDYPIEILISSILKGMFGYVLYP